MPHVLVAGKLHPSGLALLEAAPDVTYDYVEEVSEASFAPLIGAAEGLILRTQPLSAATIARAGKLRIVSRHGVGYDAVDLPALEERDITLTVVGDVNSLAVAEHAMMLLLATAKRAVRADRSVRAGDWRWRDCLQARELAGKRLLILGYGRIGRHLARLARAFGMEVGAYDPFVGEDGWTEDGATPVRALKRGLAWADMISVNVPKGERPLLGGEEFARMRPGAILVNTARGGVVDEQALAAALASGRLAGAGLDVFEDEPPPTDHPLMGFDQVVLSPHIAGLTAECSQRMAVAAVENVLDFFDGRVDPALVVSPTERLRPSSPRRAGHD
ncbi:hydroxyacid dehydrogenase [Chelativorans sp. M5D2P16]|uniref:hydroxyacid dehydrogenase n=1 Tax=Chelativorans sp. M5D2P16 TaxID=3095678 RepID=UPI002ACADD12|nr:hydroxyacid dehydrogenase [Chelativorans sp. M5D2P16]MDZ5696995.1 hydroxyacid dehydrogenase [Chelativorans sp. M5D2P16]